MAIELHQLADFMAQLADEFEENFTDCQRLASQEAVRVLASVTPVDTGKAISNWHITKAAEGVRAARGPYAPGRFGSTRDANIRRTIFQAVTDSQRIKFSDEVLIANSAPHIEELNLGKSNQAPAGFIEAAEDIIIQTFGSYRFFRRF